VLASADVLPAAVEAIAATAVRASESSGERDSLNMAVKERPWRLGAALMLAASRFNLARLD
jgi:hypothetical protein